MKLKIDEWTVMSGMTLIALVWAPHDLYCNRKVRQKARRNQRFYKEMYRGKYGY